MEDIDILKNNTKLINKSGKKKKIPHINKFNTCAYFGILDCSCCRKECKPLINNKSDMSAIVMNTEITKVEPCLTNSEASGYGTENDSSLLSAKPSTSKKEYKQLINYKLDMSAIVMNNETTNSEPSGFGTENDSSLLSAKPSTSTENGSDIMPYVISITPDINFDVVSSPLLFDDTAIFDDLRQEEPLDLVVDRVDREDEEIDVVNGTLEENLFLPQTFVKTNEIAEQQTSAQVGRIETVVENAEEEIDVVTLPVNEVILNVASTSTTEILNITRKETIVNKRFYPEQIMASYNTQNEIENDEEEIDVVNTNSETPKRKRKRTNRNRTNNTENEIIDVVNLTEDTPDFATLSTALVNFNRNLFLQNKRKLRSNTNESDLVNMAIRDESIIEITDSPVAPTVISGVITVDDDDNSDLIKTPDKTSSWGNCPVCLEDLGKCEIMSTICGHVYCAACIKTVIKTTKKCPKCRKNLTLKTIHPLFLD